jgi:hypothetical protein
MPKPLSLVALALAFVFVGAVGRFTPLCGSLRTGSKPRH